MAMQLLLCIYTLNIYHGSNFLAATCSQRVLQTHPPCVKNMFHTTLHADSSPSQWVTIPSQQLTPPSQRYPCPSTPLLAPFHLPPPFPPNDISGFSPSIIIGPSSTRSAILRLKRASPFNVTFLIREFVAFWWRFLKQEGIGKEAPGWGEMI